MVILRALGILLGLVLVAGFGLCGLFGIVVGVDLSPVVIGLGVLGLATSVAIAWALWRILHKNKSAPAPPPDA